MDHRRCNRLLRVKVAAKDDEMTIRISDKRSNEIPIRSIGSEFGDNQAARSARGADYGFVIHIFGAHNDIEAIALEEFADRLPRMVWVVASGGDRNLPGKSQRRQKNDRPFKRVRKVHAVLLERICRL